MRIEIPDCRRCCFCLPLRLGIIILGYLNALFAVLVITLEVWLGGDDLLSPTMSTYKGVGFYAQAWFPLLLYSLELIFNIVLVVGAHTNDVRLMRIYYYFGITTALATFVTFLVVNRYPLWDWRFSSMEICVAFCGLIIQAYHLLLIRSELSKLRYREGQLSYVNHVAEVTLDPSFGDGGRNPL